MIEVTCGQGMLESITKDDVRKGTKMKVGSTYPLSIIPQILFEESYEMGVLGNGAACT